jgi:hypothetical protein
LRSSWLQRTPDTAPLHHPQPTKRRKNHFKNEQTRALLHR